MLEDYNTSSLPMSDADEYGDIKTRTLALLRRILVGNGYRFDQVDLIEEESKDILIPGRFDLNLSVSHRLSKQVGLSSGRENQLFHVRDHFTAYLNNAENTIRQEGTWLREVRGLTTARPDATWGVKDARWPLNTLSQVIALVLPCECCHGEKVEVCQHCHGQRETTCQHCYEKGQIPCPNCRGTGSDPQSNNGSPCPHCRGMRYITCPRCQGRGRIMCPHCHGEGRTPCTFCQGHGFFTETADISVAVTGSFRVGAPSPKPPDAVLSLLDKIGVAKLREGHAHIIADASMRDSPDATIFSCAVLPYARFTLKLDGADIEVQSVGLRPVLAQFPMVLDKHIAPILPQLSLMSLPKYCEQFRLVRELSDALAAGTKPRAFFINRYPYGISPQVGLELAERIRLLFSGATSQPRLIAAFVSTFVAASIIYVWLVNPRPDFLPAALPASVADTGLVSLLAFLSFAIVEVTGRITLKNLLAPNAKVASAGGYIAMFAFAAVLAIGILLLWVPDIRPEWVNALLQRFGG